MFCDEHGTADFCGECVYEPQLAARDRALEVAHLALVFCKPEMANSHRDSDKDRAFKHRALEMANDALAQIEAVKEKGHE